MSILQDIKQNYIRDPSATSSNQGRAPEWQSYMNKSGDAMKI